MRPSSTPTIGDLYLAFRQAKTALFFEKRGVGLLGLAAYEQDLPRNLKALQKKLGTGHWFDKLEVGETWIVPKRLRANDDGKDDIVRIGPSRLKNEGRSLEIQLRLTPHPDFAIAEVLYLWRFGGLLDQLLMDPEVIGYRLDIRDQQILPHRRWLFQYWPSRYQQFRTAPLEAAKTALGRGDQTVIINGDLASFYDTVDPSFMLGEQVVGGLRARGASQIELDGYGRATASLLRAYGRYRKVASRRTALPITVGIPIGALTSRVVANLSLAPLDTYIAARPGVLCYRRYVDDLVIVAKTCDSNQNLLQALREYLPLLDLARRRRGPGIGPSMHSTVMAPSSSCKRRRFGSTTSSAFQALTLLRRLRRILQRQ